MTSVVEQVQLNPTVSSREPAFLANVVERVELHLCTVLNMPEGLSKRKGYSKSDAGASENIAALATNTLLVSVNGYGWKTLTLTLAGLTTGAAIATALQEAIRAAEDGTGVYEEVDVVFAGGVYTATTGRYGRGARIEFSASDGEHHVLRALKLSALYGGTEAPGAFDHPGGQALAVKLAQQWFRQAQAEGNSDRVPSESEISVLVKDPVVNDAIVGMRRL